MFLAMHNVSIKNCDQFSSRFIRDNYHPQRSWGKIIFLQASVILFTWGGVCLSTCWDTPWQGDPLSKETPLARRPSWQGDPPHIHCMLGDTVYKRAVCILLECNLVGKLQKRFSARSGAVRQHIKLCTDFLAATELLVYPYWFWLSLSP